MVIGRKLLGVVKYLMRSVGRQSLQHNKQYVIKTPLVSRSSSNKVDTQRDLRITPKGHIYVLVQINQDPYSAL